MIRSVPESGKEEGGKGEIFEKYLKGMHGCFRIHALLDAFACTMAVHACHPFFTPPICGTFALSPFTVVTRFRPAKKKTMLHFYNTYNSPRLAARVHIIFGDYFHTGTNMVALIV